MFVLKERFVAGAGDNCFNVNWSLEICLFVCCVGFFLFFGIGVVWWGLLLFLFWWVVGVVVVLGWFCVWGTGLVVLGVEDCVLGFWIFFCCCFFLFFWRFLFLLLFGGGFVWLRCVEFVFCCFWLCVLVFFLGGVGVFLCVRWWLFFFFCAFVNWMGFLGFCL